MRARFVLPSVRGDKRLTALVLFWFAFAFVPELVLHSLRPLESGAVGAVVFAVTALASFTLWWLLAANIAALRARSPLFGWAAIVAVGPAGVLLTVGSIHYRWFFGTDIRPIAVGYFLQNPLYAASLVEHSLTPIVRLALAGGAAFGILGLGLLTAKPFAEKARPPRLALALVAAALALVSIPAAGFSRYPCLAEVRGLRALALGVYARARSGALRALPVPDRRAVLPAKPNHTPDIVLIINESLGAAQIAPWNGEAPMPRGLSAFIGEHGEHAIWFPKAVVVAPITAISVPSILSGLAADAPVADFARAPLLWHEARARGYRTAFFSAQDFNVDFFRGFYLADGGPDESKNANDHPTLPRVNDRGIADAQVVDDAIAFLERAPKDQPIFLVVQLNATHWPCWAPQYAHAEPTVPERCQDAVHYIDAALGRLAEGISHTRDMENVLLIGTADHGESFDQSRPPRAVNFHEEVLRVPLFLHVPEKLAASAPEKLAALRENRARRVSNVDIFPTLLDIWNGLPLDAERPPIAGESLVRPLPSDRPMLAIADTAIWDSFADGFAFYDGSSKWIIDEFHGVQLFDMQADPNETNNLAAPPPDAALARLRTALDRHPRARQICERVAPWVVEGAWAARASW